MQVGLSGPAVWIRVIGRGSFQNSGGIKQVAAKMSALGRREFIIDLKDCELMDSTFMGTLAGIALKLGDGGRMSVIRANARNRQVLTNLGLDRILSLADIAPAAPPQDTLRDIEGLPPEKADRAAIIEAHENLVAANPENAIRFKDVIDFLKQEDAGG